MQTKHDLRGFEKDPAVREFLQGDRFISPASDELIDQEKAEPRKKEPKK